MLLNENVQEKGYHILQKLREHFFVIVAQVIF